MGKEAKTLLATLTPMLHTLLAQPKQVAISCNLPGITCIQIYLEAWDTIEKVYGRQALRDIAKVAYADSIASYLREN